MQTYKNADGVDCVLIFNEDGSSWSGLKSAWEATLASESPAAPTA